MLNCIQRTCTNVRDHVLLLLQPEKKPQFPDGEILYLWLGYTNKITKTQFSENNFFITYKIVCSYKQYIIDIKITMR